MSQTDRWPLVALLGAHGFEGAGRWGPSDGDGDGGIVIDGGATRPVLGCGEGFDGGGGETAAGNGF